MTFTLQPEESSRKTFNSNIKHRSLFLWTETRHEIADWIKSGQWCLADSYVCKALIWFIVFLPWFVGQNLFIIYVQCECIKKYQFELCSNMIENNTLTSYLDKSYLVASWGGYVASTQMMSSDKVKYQPNQQLRRVKNLFFRAT